MIVVDTIRAIWTALVNIIKSVVVTVADVVPAPLWPVVGIVAALALVFLVVAVRRS